MKRVWIVDDDEEMIRAVQMMLKLLDCEASFFLNARQAAREFLVGRRPDLLILDIQMPEVTGIDLLEFLRRRPEWQDLPVLMLSSEAADLQVDQALALGADAYLTKPVSVQELAAAIQKVFLGPQQTSI